ncbi:hypothetical protein DFJ77DRAFT_363548 [Powellomyces hirtus]|nr:hypothetical protein DFJ77DRAFT_363548 [Powellomyces hirtus]
MKLRVLSSQASSATSGHPPVSPTSSTAEDENSQNAVVNRPEIRSPGEFRAWVRSWIALSRLYTYHDGGRSDSPPASERGSVRSFWKRYRGKKPTLTYTAKLQDMPPEILHQIASYLGPRDLAALLQTPSDLLSEVAQAAIARRRHKITCLANLHTFLAYGGQSPLFYRTATMMLFGRHFVRLVPEARSLLGLGYAVILAWFMVLFYTLPFLLVIAIYLILDMTTLMTRTTASLLLHTSPLVTTHHFPSFFRTPPKSSYTHTVRDLSFSGTTDPNTPTRGLLNPWASHLYLLTNCCPNLRRLHLVGCSLAWWFRLAKLVELQDLVLEGCELDETGLEILAESCGKGVQQLTFVGGEVRGGENPDDNSGGGVTGYQVSTSSNGAATEPLVTFPCLTHISIKSHTTIDLSGLKLILDRAPNLCTISYSPDCKALHASLVKFCEPANEQGICLVKNVDGLRQIQ